MDKEQKLRIIWHNENGSRYAAMANHLSAYGWGVYDRLEKKFVDDRLDEIDPAEPLVKS